MDVKEWLSFAIGETEAEVENAVKEAGYEWRVTKRDGVPAICTRDRRMNRVNVWIEAGIVKSAYLG